MSKRIYIIRHCEAESQSPEAKLTEEGLIQANILADFLSNIPIGRVISSPFLRAKQTIRPFAGNRNLKIEEDHRLSERLLSSKPLPDWLDKLETTFNDMDVKYEGGESSNEAMSRIVNVVEDISASHIKNTIIVTHGNLMSLLLNYYDSQFGFKQWKSLSNPDVYLLSVSKEVFNLKHVWKSD